jgi:hypothetical protein
MRPPATGRIERALPFGSWSARRPPPTRRLENAPLRGILALGRVPLPVGRAGFKPVGGRVGVLGRFDSCLFRHLH